MAAWPLAYLRAIWQKAGLMATTGSEAIDSSAAAAAMGQMSGARARRNSEISRKKAE